MKDGLPVIAIVPARGGDHEVPYLNVKKLGGLPLIAHTLEEAKKSRYIDRLVVSTDADHVAEAAEGCVPNACPFRRPFELAADDAPLQSVVRHAVESVERMEGARFEIVVTLQATSPFRTAEQMDEAIDELVGKDLDSVISLKEIRSLTWRMRDGKLEPLFERPGRRDELEPLYQEDGAIRVVRRRILDGGSRLGERVGYVLMDKMSSLTVHDIYDFWLAERLTHLPRVLFRVDGGGEMGMGHVSRCLAAAKALAKISPTADICFLMRAEFPEGVQQVSREGYPLRVLSGREALAAIRDYSPNVIVNDLPYVEDAYLRSLATLGASTIHFVDTLADIENPTAMATTIIAALAEDRVEVEDYKSFAILRDSFQERARASSATHRDGRHLVVTFGGSDPQKLTLKALRALDELQGGTSVTVVLGPAFAHGKELDELLPSLGYHPRVLRHVEHMADVLFEADLVLCSGGMTVFEIAALGRPGIVLCQNAREEARMARFSRHGSILHLGLGTEVEESVLRGAVLELLSDRERRERMGRAGCELVDGQGASLAAIEIREKSGRGPANGGRRK